MRVGILMAQSPFGRGKAEAHALKLRGALRDAGAAAEIIAIPFKKYPADAVVEQILACQLLDVSESCGVRIERVIGLDFPAYHMLHPDKILWLRHRPFAYGAAKGQPDMRDANQLIQQADRAAFGQARYIFTQSQNVTNRLDAFSGVASTPLYPPLPDAEHYAWREAEDFLFMPGRVMAPMRQALVLSALALTRNAVKVVFAGRSGEDAYEAEIRRLNERLESGRVRWLGDVAAAQMRALFGSCLGVLAMREDADTGDVALAAMLSSKPVITCADSGGPLDFVVDGQTGRVCVSEAEALAEAMDRLWEDRAKASNWGRAGRARYDGLGLSWNNVAEAVLA